MMWTWWEPVAESARRLCMFKDTSLFSANLEPALSNRSIPMKLYPWYKLSRTWVLCAWYSLSKISMYINLTCTKQVKKTETWQLFFYCMHLLGSCNMEVTYFELQDSEQAQTNIWQFLMLDMTDVKPALLYAHHTSYKHRAFHVARQRIEYTTSFTWTRKVDQSVLVVKPKDSYYVRWQALRHYNPWTTNITISYPLHISSYKIKIKIKIKVKM